MINIGPSNPPVSTPKIKQYHSKEAAVAGSEINKDAENVQRHPQQDRRRRGKDRRERRQQSLIDLRSGRDRRDTPGVPTIDIEV